MPWSSSADSSDNTDEGGIATPLIAHWPNGILPARRGQLEHQPGHLVDIMATCLDVAGAKYPTEFKGKSITPLEGVSLRPAFEGRPLKRAEPLFWEHEGNRAILDNSWKLVALSGQPWRLYDTAADRTEQHDLASAQPERVKRQLADQGLMSEEWGGQTVTVEVSAKQKKNLELLLEMLLLVADLQQSSKPTPRGRGREPFLKPSSTAGADHNDLPAFGWISQGQRILQLGCDDILLVVSRDQDRDLGSDIAILLHLAAQPGKQGHDQRISRVNIDDQ